MSKLAVWPYVFTLHAATLIEAYRRGDDRVALAATDGLAQLGIPVALHWLTTPELGFPRRPFNVYRRARKNIPSEVIRNILTSPAPVDEASTCRFRSAATVSCIWSSSSSRRRRTRP
jgi:hypothetical protein